MLPVLLLLAKQYLAVLGLTALYLLISRWIGGQAFYQDQAIVILVFVLTAFVVIGAIQGIFVRPWWLYLIGSSICGIVSLGLMFVLIDLIGPGTNDKVGAAATAFLFPMLAFFFLYPLGGVIQWLIGLLQKPGGA